MIMMMMMVVMIVVVIGEDDGGGDDDDDNDDGGDAQGEPRPAINYMTSLVISRSLLSHALFGIQGMERERESESESESERVCGRQSHR